MSIGRAQKFGFIPVFLNYLKFWNRPEYPKAVRAMHGLLGLLDIIPICQDVNVSFVRAKAAFGIGAPDVRFHGFWEQKVVRPEREDVKASFYTRERSALVVLTNLGEEPFNGPVHLDLRSMGLDPRTVTVRNAEAKDATFPMQGGAMRLEIPRHDYRLLWLVATR